MKINWIYPPPNLSGGVKSNRLLAEAMVRRGHQVRIIYPKISAQWPPITKPRRFGRKIMMELSVIGRQRHHLEKSAAEIVAIPEMPISDAVVPKADFAIATWWETRHWIESWDASRGLPVYMIRHHELHGGDVERVAATYRMPGRKFVISNWLRRVMKEDYGQDSVLIPNGVDRGQFNASPRKKSVTPTVGFLYGHQPWKGTATALEAVRRAQRTLPALKVVAFGSTPLPKGVALPNHFKYYLRPSQDIIPAIYRSCDCWLVSSTLEGFGMPGLEAAACRCPVVTTRCGGPEDYVEDSVNGRLVDVGDAVAMADAVLEVVCASAPRWAEMSESSHRISNRFDWDDSARRMESVLKEDLLNAMDGELNEGVNHQT